ncbi:TPA: hypothetical protein N0F65_005066 [Lagenidium giganteum]|uniref:Uncharacterized protein n=1 Tax=Lagenidium giganteum TaxID=4803 RepID=A0AAV2ZCQ1_9STRA|nr:TPA: hypothetical protein N0F65_005066 [Lagenidium giganteum]
MSVDGSFVQCLGGAPFFSVFMKKFDHFTVTIRRGAIHCHRGAPIDPMMMQITHKFQMTEFGSCVHRCFCCAWRSVLLQELNDVESSTLGGSRKHSIITNCGARIVMEERQHFEMAVLGCFTHRCWRHPCSLALAQEILDDVQTANGGGSDHGLVSASFGSMRMQELDDVEVATSRSHIHCPLGAAERMIEVQALDDVKVTIFRCDVHHGCRDVAIGKDEALLEKAHNGKVSTTGCLHHGFVGVSNDVHLHEPLENGQCPRSSRIDKSVTERRNLVLIQRLHHIQSLALDRQLERTGIR